MGAESADADDSALVLRLADGDLAAFEVLYRRHSGPLRAHLARRLAGAGGGPAAEDLVQEVFLRVLRSAEQFDRHRPFGAWLSWLAENVLVDAYRHRTVRPAEVLLDAADWNGLPDESDAADPAVVVLYRLDVEALCRAVARLPPIYRDVVVARLWEGLTAGEIAARLGITPGAVRWRMHEAVRRLRQAARGVSGGTGNGDPPAPERRAAS